MTVRQVSVTALKRVYPHVDEVEDWRAAQTLRLLWDRVHGLEERLQAAQATITSLVTASNANEAATASAATDARQALAIAQQAAGEAGAGDGTGAGTGDGGAGQIGCNAAGATGHDSGGLLNAIRAGQIVCGTGNEFPALRNPTSTFEARKANSDELLLRMVWHLKQAGFTAGKQRNMRQRICVVVDGVLRLYLVFRSEARFEQEMKTQMAEILTETPAMEDVAGIPD